jgi:phosphoglycerate dehydrogenase-like enzyme
LKTKRETTTLRTFEIRLSGDMLNEQGEPANGYFGQDIFQSAPFVHYAFLHDQAPHDPSYWDRLYSLEMEPHHIADAHGLVIIRPYVRASLFARGAENLVVIGRAGVGTDKIDMRACTENDVAVFNAPESLTHSTASAAMVFILALAKRLPAQERMARSGCWKDQASVTGDDLTGQTLGIIGLGRISRELIRLLAPFRMRVLIWSRHCTPEEAAAINATLVPDLDTLLGESDYVSLHCALNDKTRGFFGKRELRRMKPTAYFINTGRGELVDEAALVRALEERWFAGAGLDVFEEEPLPAEHPLMRLDNVILTPHWLPSTHQAVKIVGVAMAQGMVRAAQGLIPENVVNSDVLGRPGFLAKLDRFRENAPVV